MPCSAGPRWLRQTSLKTMRDRHVKRHPPAAPIDHPASRCAPPSPRRSCSRSVPAAPSTLCLSHCFPYFTSSSRFRHCCSFQTQAGFTYSNFTLDSGSPILRISSGEGWDSTNAQLVTFNSASAARCCFSSSLSSHAYSHLLATLRATTNSTTPIPTNTATCGHRSVTGKSRQNTFVNPSIAQALIVSNPAFCMLSGIRNRGNMLPPTDAAAIRRISVGYGSQLRFVSGTRSPAASRTPPQQTPCTIPSPQSPADG